MDTKQLLEGFLKAAKSAPDRELRKLVTSLQNDVDNINNGTHIPGQTQMRLIAAAKERRTGKRQGITMKATKK